MRKNGHCADCEPSWDGEFVTIEACDACGQFYCHRCQEAHDCILTRCPKTSSGRMPEHEIAECEYCPGMDVCRDYTIPIPLHLEPVYVLPDDSDSGG